MIIGVGIHRGKHYYGLLHLGKSLRKKPSNEKVKSYITYIEGRKAVIGNLSTWGDLRETYRQVIALDYIDYKLKVQLFEALRVKGTRGIYHPRNLKHTPGVDKEERIKQAGEEGERQVEHDLKWLDEDKYKIFNNIRLSDGRMSQEFDTIVVGSRAVFNIETKNYIGDLTIDKGGNWYRTINGTKSGTESPVFQVQRHNKILNKVLESKIPIVDLIVWTNVESVIEGVQYSPVKIIKVDQLTYFIESFNQGRALTSSERDFTIRAINR